MLTLVFIVFLDLVGFGMIIPVFPFYAERVGVSPSSVIFFLGLYSAGQLVGAPLWGALSDRIGRRPVLLLTLLANAAASAMLAFSTTGTALALSRIVAGLAAGNISAAYAYTTDITTDATRPKALGLLGSAFGMGFIMGPALGGLLAGGSDSGASLARVANAAAILSLIAFALTVVRLPESLPPEKRHQPKTARAGLRTFLARPVLRTLLIATVLIVAAVASLQTTLAIFTAERMAVGPRTLGWIFGYTGVISVAIQAGIIGRLTLRFGPQRLARTGGILAALGIAGVPFAPTLPWLLATLGLFSLGSALFNPSMSGLVAASANPQERGSVLGAYQGAASLGRVIGPMVSSAFASVASLSLPFLVGAVMGIAGAVVIRERPLGGSAPPPA